MDQYKGRTVRHFVKGDSFLSLVVRPVAIELARQLLANREDAKVLDLGCGTGRWTFPLVNLVREVIGIDLSTSMLEVARTQVSGVIFYQLDMLHLAQYFAPNSVDLVQAMLSFQHLTVEQLGQILAQIQQVLKPGGELIITAAHPVGMLNSSGWIRMELPEGFHYGSSQPVGCRIRNTTGDWTKIDLRLHSMSTYMNAIVESGLQVIKVLEPMPQDSFTEEQIIGFDLQDERSPLGLIIHARRVS